MITDPTQAHIILGARVWFVRTGAPASDAGGNKVSSSVLPELPDSYSDAGKWTCLGKIRTAQPQIEKKTADVEGVSDDGTYTTTELTLLNKVKVQFTTNDIVPEAFELTFGLKEAIKSGGEQAIFANGSGTISGWLVFELTDAYRGEVNLARVCMFGELGLQNALQAQSDPAQAEYEFSMLANPLAKFVENALVPVA